jgi:hypothetical protein
LEEIPLEKIYEEGDIMQPTLEIDEYYQDLLSVLP